jgi:hypothetical protein
MYYDFDDFQDEYDHIRQSHINSLDHDQYGEYYDPNSESFYDLDIFPLEYAKSLFHGLGDRARYKGFNRVGEKIPLEDYFDDEGKSIQFPMDNPHDLYHPNNQTILDPAAMPDKPIDPEKFVEKVVVQLKSHSVLISKDMPELLERMCRLFNFSIHPNKELPKTVKNLVFPAQTGIGKSVSVQVYVSMLEKYSSIVVVAKVEEAIKYCNYINKLSSDENYARCYYSLTDKNKDDPMRVEAIKLKDYRCIIITHNMFQRVNGFDDIGHFGDYKNKARDFVSIDEKLSFYEKYRLNYSQLDKLIANVEVAIKQSELLGGLASSNDVLNVLKQFKAFLLFKDDKIVTNDKSIVVRGRLAKNVEQQLANIGEDINYSMDSDTRINTSKLEKLKNKNAVLNILRTNGVATQSRKRKVTGVPFMEVHKVLMGLFSDIDSFYCEKINPLLSVCRSRDEVAAQNLDDELEDFENLTDEEMEKLVSSVEQEDKEGVHARGLELATHILKVMLGTWVGEIFNSLEALGAKKNPYYKSNTLNSINEIVDTLNYFSRNHFLIYKSNYETALIATENLTNRLGLSVVLDATAQVNEYYKLANRFLGHVGLVKAPQIRKYKNLTINKAIGFKQSRAAIYDKKTTEEVQSIAKCYASYLLNELVGDDEVLVICHKDFVSELKKQVNDTRVEFTHWGNHVGRNDLSHCNKVILIGWPTLNPIEYISIINSSLESGLLTSRHLDDELLEKFEISQLADDIIQGLMRSQARVIATADSDCKETSFYLFYEDNGKAQKILGLVESQFPKATLVDWHPNGTPIPKKKGKRNKNAVRVIELLVEKSKDHETYLRVDVQNELSINKSTMTRIVGSDYFKNKLIENGITFNNKNAKSQQFVLS